MRSSFLFAALLYQISACRCALRENPIFVEIECGSIPVESYCNDESNGWCTWDGTHCSQSYDSNIFVSSLDLLVMSKGLITYIIVTLAMFVYYLSGVLLNKIKLHIVSIDSDHEKLDKCQIYIFELIGLTVGLIWLLYHGTFDPLFNPNQYMNLSPQQAMHLIRSISGFLLISWMYAIEMLTNKLRWSLQMHHVVTIIMGWYCVFLFEDFADFAAFRCTMAMTLYAFTEHNVFAQLLLYRIYPLFAWQMHLISAILFVLSRLFVIIVTCVTYYDWATTDTVRNQFNGSEPTQYVYMVYFFFIPVANVLLNVAQFQTIKALFYMTFSVRKRLKQHNELNKYPRLQALYDIFIEFDDDDNGHWTMADWKWFMLAHSTFINHDTCLILWNVLGFQYDDPQAKGIMAQLEDSARQLSRMVSRDAPQVAAGFEVAANVDIDETEEANVTTERNELIGLTSITVDAFETDVQNKTRKKKGKSSAKEAQSPVPHEASIIKEKYMKWDRLRRIFGAHLIAPKYKEYTVKQVISAQIQVLLQTIFSAQSDYEQLDNAKQRTDTLHQLYFDVDELIGDRHLRVQKSIGNYIVANDRDNGGAGSNNQHEMDKQLTLNSLVRNRLHKYTSA